jgi:hypothetical protein
MWAFREAVAGAGYYERGGAAVRDYYDRVGGELEAARKSGRLKALPGRATLRPPLLPGQIQAVASTWLRGLLRVPRFTDFSVSPRYSAGDAAPLREYAVTRSELAPRRSTIVRTRLKGWAVHVDGALDLRIDPAHDATVRRLPSPAFYEHLAKTWKPFEPARHAAFEVVIPGEDRSLVLSLRGQEIERIPLGTTAPRTNHPDVRMNIETFAVEAKPNHIPFDGRLRALAWIGRAYQIAFLPLLAVAGLICAVRWRGDRKTLVLIAASLAAIAARVLILALIDVTSFFVFTPGYEAPSHALLLVAGAMLFNESGRSLPARTGSTARSDAPDI